MKFLRTLFVVLLCAVLPLTGLAASGTAGQCPMQATMADSGSAMSESTPGCESMAAPASQDNKSKGTLCKVTAQCQMGSCITRFPHRRSLDQQVRSDQLFSNTFKCCSSASLTACGNPLAQSNSRRQFAATAVRSSYV
jgi:hypothetical protein